MDQQLRVAWQSARGEPDRIYLFASRLTLKGKDKRRDHKRQ